MKKLHRRHFIQTAAAAAALPATPAVVRADTYPSRPVRIVVGFAPSGAADIIARLMAQKLTGHFGQAFVVENRPGAAMNIATGLVAKAAPDGYTLLNITTVNAWNGSLFKHLDFDFLRDITPVASI